MKKELKFINLDYSDNDIKYINNLCNKIDIFSNEVVDFFEIKNFGEKVNIKLWNNLEEFRLFHKELFHKKELSTYVVGFSCKDGIHTLSLSEYQKAKTNKNVTLEDLEKLIIHEFVHSVHRKLNCNQFVIW